MTSLKRANGTCVEIVLVYDLEELRWQSKWVPNQDYAVPMLISAIIGGRYVPNMASFIPDIWVSQDSWKFIVIAVAQLRQNLEMAGLRKT